MSTANKTSALVAGAIKNWREGSIWLWALTIAIGGWQAPLWAQFSKHPELQKAADHFYDKQYGKASHTIQTFLDSVVIESPDEILAYQYLAFSYYKLKDPQADVTIRQALARNIHTEGDSAWFAQEYRDFFGYTKAKLVGRVRIMSTPFGARLFINEKFVGATPIDTLLLTGKYNLRLEQEGYRSTLEPYVVQGGNSSWSTTLTPAPKRRNLKWYATSGALLTGGAVYFIVKGKEKETELSPLSEPPEPKRP